jgi:hypothetical protein
VNWEDLRDTIESDPVLADLLGTYTLKTATATATVPAVHCFPPQLANDRAVSGLEIIIQKTPDTGNEARFFNELARRKTYTVRLIQHDKGAGLEGAIDRLLTLFPSATARLLPSTDIADEQAVIRIPDGLKRVAL